MDDQELKNKKFDLEITPLRLSIIVLALAVVIANNYFDWNSSLPRFAASAVIPLSFILSKPRIKNN